MYLLGLAGSIAFYLIYQEWFSWIVLMIVLFLPWLSLLLSLWAMLGIRVKLRSPEQVWVGDECSARVELSCSAPLPPSRCRIRVTEQHTGQRRILRRGERLPTEHCGGLVCELYRGRVYDYLGLFGLRIRHAEAVKVRVMPRPLEIRVPPTLTRMIAQSWRPKKGGGYGEQHEIRPYQTGDMLNLVHWKLSAKMDSLMVREPMIPDQGRILLRLELNGTADELDRKLGRLLWLGEWLLSENVPFEVQAVTGNGYIGRKVRSPEELILCMDALLFAPAAPDDCMVDEDVGPSWQYRIGGETDEE